MEVDDPRRNLLVIDDDYSVCKFLMEIFSQEGFKCQSCLDAREAVRLMATMSFDVVLLDLVMPGPTGIQLLSVVKEKYPRTVFVVVSGMDDPEFKADAKKRGAAAYIVKPFTPEEAVATVKRALAT